VGANPCPIMRRPGPLPMAITNSSVMYWQNAHGPFLYHDVVMKQQSMSLALAPPPASPCRDQRLGFATSRSRRWPAGSGLSRAVFAWSASMSASRPCWGAAEIDGHSACHSQSTACRLVRSPRPFHLRLRSAGWIRRAASAQANRVAHRQAPPSRPPIPAGAQ